MEKPYQPVSNTRHVSARGRLWLVKIDHVMDVERSDWSIRSNAVKTHHVDTAAAERLGEFRSYPIYTDTFPSKSYFEFNIKALLDNDI